MRKINPRDLVTCECYDPHITHDYCGLGHPQYTQIFKTPVSVTFSNMVPKVKSVISLLNEGFDRHVEVIAIHMMAGHGFEGHAELEGDAGEMPYRVMAGFREMQMMNNDVGDNERLGILFLRTRLIKIYGPRPGNIWVEMGPGFGTGDEPPEPAYDHETICYDIISELALGLPNRDGRSNWGETITLQQTWDKTLKRCEENTRAYIEGLAIGKKVRGNA